MTFEEAWRTNLAYKAHKNPKEFARAAWEAGYEAAVEAELEGPE